MTRSPVRAVWPETGRAARACVVLQGAVWSETAGGHAQSGPTRWGRAWLDRDSCIQQLREPQTLHVTVTDVNSSIEHAPPFISDIPFDMTA
jgi:hypothetical protein